MRRQIGIVGVIVIGLSMAMVAQAGDQKNAATWYRRAIKAYESLPADVKEALWNYDWSNPNAPATAEFRLALAQVQPVLRLTHRGARQGYSDFDLDYAQGVDLLLPHLQSMRGITKLMRADALVRMRDGDTAGAAAAVASIYRMGGHLGSDRILISSLVGQAIFNAGDVVAQAGVDRAAFTPEDSAIMIMALRDFSATDPFEYVEAISMEQEIMIGWIAEKYSGEDGPQQVADLFQGTLPESEQTKQLRSMTEEEFSESLDQVDQLMNGVIEAFMDPDQEAGRAAMDEIIEELRAGEHGVLAMVMIPSYNKIFDRRHEAERRIADRTASLALLMTGELSPQAGANAVMLYLRAIVLLDEIDPEQRRQWLILAADPDEPIDDDVVKSLTEAEPIIAVLREASHTARCDFSAARYDLVPAIPAYLPGFRELANLLVADADRLLQAGEVDGAVDRLETCYRMSAHLATDGVITSALVSHAMFNAADAILQRELTQAFFEDVHRELLHQALETMSRKDPFGYIAGITSARKEIDRWLRSMRQRGVAAQLDLSESTRGWDVDRLLAWLVAARHIQNALAWPEAPLDSLAPLDGVLALDAIAAVAGQSAEIRAMINAGEAETLSDCDFPLIARVRQQLARARADLRRSVRVLMHQTASDLAADGG
ncbi:MAG: hypothetical protein O7F17_06410 [Planctomycetota bacterium]|nr:hypothetical protein [Planctomycetota bacterium]